MNIAADRPYANPEAAARKLVEIAKGIVPTQEDRIFIENINAPMLNTFRAAPAEYKAGLDYAIAQGWLEMHRSGTYVRLNPSGSDLFAWN